MHPEIRKFLAEGATVITPTRNLARDLVDRYVQAQLKEGKTSWRSADILDWETWCRRTWDSLLPALPHCPVLLNVQQEHSLWMRVVCESRAAQQLLHLADTARQARESYRLCKAWQIPIFPENVFLNDDAFQFRQWVQAYEQELNAHDWIDSAGLLEQLIAALQGDHGLEDEKRVFYGFDRWLPAPRQLFHLLKSVHSGVVEIPAPRRDSRCRLFSADDATDELNRAAAWARQSLEQTPSARIGIIVPRLGRTRGRIESVFNRHFCTETLLARGPQQAPFAIAQGRPLAEYPLIDAAMRILSLQEPEISQPDLSALLTSPWIGGFHGEAGERAMLDARLRQRGQRQYTIAQLVSLPDGLRKQMACSRFFGQLNALMEHARKTPRRIRAGEWVVRFAESLAIMGWPGDQPLDSAEHQTMAAWKQALDTLVSLDLVAAPMDYRTARGRLSAILGDTGFQPESTAAPIQILGPDAAAAMEFDRLWICGLDDQNWPSPVQPLAFVPTGLQREAGLPQASSALQLAEAEARLDRLAHSAGDVVVSYASAEGDQVLRPSPVLDSLDTGPPDEEAGDPNYYEQVVAAAALETFIDDRAPAVAAGAERRGRSTLFKDQALCPFRAFAHHRLAADSVESVDIGLSPRDRGNLVHRSLQFVWQKLNDWQTLQNPETADLRSRISEAVESALHRYERDHPDILIGRFRNLEAERLMRQVNDWLDIERDRAPFRVDAIEQPGHVHFAGLDLHMRLDRIDRLEDGRLVIIDYKTGRFNPADWETDRPSDPQLPLYAVTCEGNIGAVVFAGVKPGDMRFAGIQQEDKLLPGKSVRRESDWATRINGWRDVLASLADEYLRGESAVLPRDRMSCRYCDLHALCRIDEKIEVAVAGEDDEPDYY